MSETLERGLAIIGLIHVTAYSVAVSSFVIAWTMHRAYRHLKLVSVIIQWQADRIRQRISSRAALHGDQEG